MEAKKLIRKQIFSARKACSDQEVEQWSRQLTERLISLPEFQEAKQILVYADYNHEVMTGFLIQEAWKSGKEVAVPKVSGKDMIFYKLTDFSQLEPGYFGIPEPTRGEIAEWEDGGFYDRYLEKHPALKRIAAAFEFQILPEVPTEPTDISPEIIVTEKQCIRI